MIDPKLLRQDTEAVAANLARRGFEFDAGAYLALEEQRKSLQVETEELRNERNTSSKNIGKAKAQGEDIAPLLEAVKNLGDKLENNEAELQTILGELRSIELGLPNLMADDVPDGKSEEDNVEVRRWGEPTELDFPAKDHIELGERTGMLDFETASKISGSRFAVMRGQLARMQRALIQFMLDTHTQDHGYVETYVPYLVQYDALVGTGQLPKFEEDLFKTTTETPFYLIPTAEVPVTNFARDMIFEADQLPMRYTAHTPCFRSEAGSSSRRSNSCNSSHRATQTALWKN
jgi:seryl-tRNA synthetase